MGKKENRGKYVKFNNAIYFLKNGDFMNVTIGNGSGNKLPPISNQQKIDRVEWPRHIVYLDVKVI